MARPPIELRRELAAKAGAKHVAWVLYSYVDYRKPGEWIVWAPMEELADECSMSVRALREEIAVIRSAPGNWVLRVIRKDYNDRPRSVLLLRKGDPRATLRPSELRGGEDPPVDRLDLADPPADFRRQTGELPPPTPGELPPPDRRTSAAHPASLRRQTGGSSYPTRRTFAPSGESSDPIDSIGGGGDPESTTTITATTAAVDRSDRRGIASIEEEISGQLAAVFELLEDDRQAVLEQSPSETHWRLDAATLNVRGDRRGEAEAVLERGLHTLGRGDPAAGLPKLRAVMRWGWERVATGDRKPVEQACTFRGGGLAALIDKYGRDQEARARKAASAKPDAATTDAQSPEQRLAALKAAFASASGTSFVQDHEQRTRGT